MLIQYTTKFILIVQTAVQPGDPALAEFHHDVRASPPLRPGQGGGVCSPGRPHARRQCKHHGEYSTLIKKKRNKSHI